MADKKQDSKVYTLNIPRWRRIEKGELVTYRAGQAVELTDDEAAGFAPGRISPAPRRHASAPTATLNGTAQPKAKE